jgi:LysR family transcriptional regulator for bpeEF and oprC
MDLLFAMKVFTRVVETGSFTRAADALQLPPPTVSRTVQSLEAHFGTRLLNRTTRRLSITEDGNVCYERCVRLLDDVQDLEETVSQAKRSPKGRIKVNLPALMARSIVIPALPAFFAAYPEIEVEMGLTDRQVDIVEEGVDCVIRTGELGDSGLIARRIGQFSGTTCAAPSYLEKYGEPRTLEELQAHIGVNYVSSNSGRVRGWDFYVNGKVELVYMKSLISVNDADSYVTCGLAGLGIMKGSRYSLMEHIASGALREILTDYPPVPRPISLMYSPNRHLPRKVRVFIDWIVELFRSLPELQVKAAAVSSISSVSSG